MLYAFAKFYAGETWINEMSYYLTKILCKPALVIKALYSTKINFVHNRKYCKNDLKSKEL